MYMYNICLNKHTIIVPGSQISVIKNLISYFSKTCFIETVLLRPKLIDKKKFQFYTGNFCQSGPTCMRM